MATLNFDSTNVAPAVAPEAIPAGWYPVYMSASEMKPTTKNDGFYLSTEFTIMDGPYAKHKLFDRMNLQNANPVAVDIAYKTLSAICHAVGVIQVADSAQLHNRPLMAKVSLRAASLGADGKQYDASNEIKGYKAYEQVMAVPVQVAPIAPPVMAAPVAAQPAWAAAPAPTPVTPAQVVAAPPVTQAAPIPAAPTPGNWAPPSVQAVAEVPAVPVQAAPAAEVPASSVPVPPWMAG
jgi:hypothetical protein